MKTPKRYLVTYSFATFWFAVDTEGNVAIMKFGDEGPVPRFIRRQETCIAELLFTTMAGGKREIACMNFTDEQIDMMLAHAKQVGTVKCLFDEYYFFDGIIEIEAAYKDEIERIMCENVNKDKDDFGHVFCRLSPNRLLYYTDCNFGYYPFVMEHVKRFYDFYIDDKENISYTPFYFYMQDILNLPAVKLSTPAYPFKIEQLPKSIAARAIKLPIKFSDSQFVQFVKYYRFKKLGGYFSFVTTNNHHYVPMKDEEGNLYFYGTNREKPIEPSQVKALIEQGKMQKESITEKEYCLYNHNGRIRYKPSLYRGRCTSVPLVWKRIKEVLKDIETTPLEDLCNNT